MDITTKAKAALGNKIRDLRNMMMLPRYTRRITTIRSVLDVLIEYDQLLPEEYQEIMRNPDDHNGMVMQLAYMCRDPSIPEGNRIFMSLVTASYNMHVFGCIGMSMEDVLVFT